MHLKRLYIKDFGIFNNQSLDGLDSNLVVIGGLNRAGKTTLMTILRYLGYGFPRSKELPPATSKYEVESDLLHNEKRYNIQLNGYGDPDINIKPDDEISSIKDIYHLDYFTYQQLFTLSLDELKRIPAGVQDKEKLQSILIGAGFSEILQLPQLEEYFGKEARNIGGKYGKPHVGEFKPYHGNIKSALKKRKKANNQLETYQKAKQDLKEIEQKIEEKENELTKHNYQRDRLDLLKNNYQDYQEYLRLKTRLNKPQIRELLENFPIESINKIKDLADKYKEKLKDYRKTLSQFRRDVSDNKEMAVKNLLKYQEKISNYVNELSGLRERVNQYWDKLAEHQSQEEKLIVKAGQINSKWSTGESFREILEIDTDLLERSKLNEIINNYRELNDKTRKLEQEIIELETLLKEKKERKADIEESTETLDKSYFLITLLFVIGGFGLIYVYFWLGLLTGLSGIGGVLLYLVNKMIQNYKSHDFELDQKIKDLQASLDYKKDEFTKWSEQFAELKNQLLKYKNILDLEKSSTPETVRDYFREVKRLQEEIIVWQNQGEKLEERRAKLEEELNEIYNLLRKFSFVKLSLDTDNGLFEQSKLLLSKIKTLNEYNKIAKKLDQKEEQILALENKLNQLLNSDKSRDELVAEVDRYLKKGEEYNQYNKMQKKMDNLRLSIVNSLSTDRIKSAFKDYKDKTMNQDEKLLKAFDSFYRQYTSTEDIDITYSDCQKEIEKLRESLEQLKEKRQSIKDKIQQLQTSTKLKEAQKKIDENRTNLRKLAEKYAVNKTAQFILNKVRKRFMEKTKNKLFDKASDTFSRMTEGEYKEILPPDKLTEIDFKAVLNDDSSQRTAVLSRGTREQLFLAVRLSRIKKIKPALPVIMDDTLVNFDRYHLDQSLEIFKDISKTHQIFILTCHPHFIKHLSDKNFSAQYWKLEKGTFSKSDHSQLIDYLSKNN